jgi:streptogramin lyase
VPGGDAGMRRRLANKGGLIHSPSTEEKSLLPTARTLLVVLTAGLLAACGKGTPITSGTPTPAPTPTPAVTKQIPIPTASSLPADITLGADGNIWFTEFAPAKIGQLSNGSISESVTPTHHSGPNGIASGPGPSLNLWFTETNIAQVAQITISGPPYTEYALPNTAARPTGIVLAADGNIWVTDPGTNSIWRITQIHAKPFVLFKQVALTGNAQPGAIIVGPDSALWFTEPGTNSIGRVPVSGAPVTEYSLGPGRSMPAGIASSNDGIWIVETKARQLVRMSITGVITATYPLTNSMTPDALVQGIDGNFYFSDPKANRIGQFIVRQKVLHYYPIPTANSEPTAMTLGADHEIYVLERLGNKIAHFAYFY